MYPKNTKLYSLYKKIQKKKLLYFTSAHKSAMEKDFFNHLKICISRVDHDPILYEYVDEYFKFYPDQINMKSEKDETLLFISYCIFPYDKRVFEVLIDHNIDINCKNLNGETILHRILRDNYYGEQDIYEIVKLLLERGADVTIKNKIGYCPLAYALKYRASSRIVELLLDQGSNLDVKEFETESLLHHNKNIFERVFNRMADINVRDNYGRTILINACYYLRTINIQEILSFLCNCDVNIQDNYGNTALNYAVMYYFNLSCLPYLIKTLLEKNADIDIKNISGDNSVIMSFGIIDIDKKEIVNILLPNRRIFIKKFFEYEADLEMTNPWKNRKFDFKLKAPSIESFINIINFM